MRVAMVKPRKLAWRYRDSYSAAVSLIVTLLIRLLRRGSGGRPRFFGGLSLLMLLRFNLGGQDFSRAKPESAPDEIR